MGWGRQSPPAELVARAVAPPPPPPVPSPPKRTAAAGWAAAPQDGHSGGTPWVAAAGPPGDDSSRTRTEGGPAVGRPAGGVRPPLVRDAPSPPTPIQLVLPPGREGRRDRTPATPPRPRQGAPRGYRQDRRDRQMEVGGAAHEGSPPVPRPAPPYPSSIAPPHRPPCRLASPDAARGGSSTNRRTADRGGRGRGPHGGSLPPPPGSAGALGAARRRLGLVPADSARPPTRQPARPSARPSACPHARPLCMLACVQRRPPAW